MVYRDAKEPGVYDGRTEGVCCEQLMRLMRERKRVFPMRYKDHQPISQAPFSLESFAVVSWGIPSRPGRI
jgi:hypothetical protein